jgi:hypothetical protein
VPCVLHARLGSSSVRYLSQSCPKVYSTFPARVFSFSEPSCPSRTLQTDASVGYLSEVKVCDLMRRTPSGSVWQYWYFQA